MPHHTFRRLAPLAALALILCLVATGCARPRQAPLPVGNLKLGLAYFTQPGNPSDMLAGYAVEDVPRVDEKALGDLDVTLAAVLSEESKNSFLSKESALRCSRKIGERDGKTNNQAALRKWSAIGRCMGVDLLVVPQVLEFRERDGGNYGVTVPAKVVMDIFLIDVRNESLISRSRYDETQSALSTNLLEADKFFKRGGKWVTAHDLAREGMIKAVKELRL